MAIAGIDIGTTGCKCTVYHNDGEFLRESYREYGRVATEESETLDPEQMWQMVLEVLRESCSGVETLEAIGVTSFGEAAVLLDEKDHPVMRTLLNAHHSGRKEVAELIEIFTEEAITEITGLVPSPIYTIAKLLWIKKNYKEAYEKTRKVFLIEDYVVYKLCGVRQIDYSLASRTMAFDIKHLAWDEALLNYVGLTEEMMSMPVPIGSGAGKIQEPVAETIGINNRALIVSGCHDQIAAAVGTGTLEVGSAVDGIGTAECITPVYDRTVDYKALYSGKFAIVPFLNGNYVTYGFSMTGGAAMQWYVDQVANFFLDGAEGEGVNVHDILTEDLEDLSPTGLLVLPHFAGSGTPHMDAGSKGAIIGITMETKASHIYKALLEGVTYEMRLNAEKLAEAGIRFNRLRATGGGAKSSLWLQIKADIMNVPMVRMNTSQSGTLGSIMLAGLAAGVYKSLKEAEAIFVVEEETFYPDASRHEAYMAIFEHYKRVYNSLKLIY